MVGNNLDSSTQKEVDKKQTHKIDTQKLVHQPGIKTKYKQKIEKKLNNQTDKPWKNHGKTMEKLQKKRCPIKTKTKKIKKNNDKIESLSKEQKRNKIKNRKL